jgi:hypothetical protein
VVLLSEVFDFGFLGSAGERVREDGKLEWSDGMAPGDTYSSWRIIVSNGDDLVGCYGVLQRVPRESSQI